MSKKRPHVDAPRQEQSPLWARLLLGAVLLYSAALLAVVVADMLGRLP